MSNNEIAERSQQAPESPANAMMALIERAATSQEIDIDKLDRLLSVKERWDAAQAKQSFDRAMTSFRANVGSIQKTRDAHNSKYAGLAETLSKIRQNLTDVGLSVSWRTEQSENLVRVTCIVSHVDGHSEKTTLAASPDTSGSKNSIQAIGSTVTYLERYTVFAILGLASTDQDDDGLASNSNLISDSDLTDLMCLIDELGDKVDQPKLKGWLKTKGVRDGDYTRIPAKMVKEVFDLLERKRKV